VSNEEVVWIAVSLIHFVLEVLELGLSLVQLPERNINGGEGGMKIPVQLEVRRRVFCNLRDNAVEGLGITHEVVATGKHGVGVAVGKDAMGGGLHLAKEVGDLVGLTEGEVEGHKVVVGESGGEEVEVAHAGEEGEGIVLQAGMDVAGKHSSIGLGMRGQGGEVVLGLFDALGLGEEVEADGLGSRKEGHSSVGHPVKEVEGAGVLAEAPELLDEGEELALGGGLPLEQPGLHHGLHRLFPPRQPPEERI
jgi:hypothetical protein